MVALGSGYNTNTLKLDAAVQYRRISLGTTGRYGPRTLLTDSPPAVGLSHETDWRIKVSLIYRIADTVKLKGLFRSLFVG